VLLGLARQPLTVPAALQQLIAAASPERDAVLTVLALAGQQQRFHASAASSPSRNAGQSTRSRAGERVAS